MMRHFCVMSRRAPDIHGLFCPNNQNVVARRQPDLDDNKKIANAS